MPKERFTCVICKKYRNIRLRRFCLECGVICLQCVIDYHSNDMIDEDKEIEKIKNELNETAIDEFNIESFRNKN